MVKLVRKYQKQIMAIFAVGLMIQFVASLGYNRGQGNRRNDTAIGTIGGKTVYQSEQEEARREWNTVKQYVYIKDASGRTVPYTNFALVGGMDLLMNANFEEVQAELIAGRQLAEAIEQQPELFMLLRHEAHESGVFAQQDRVQRVMVNLYHPPTDQDTDLEEQVRQGVTDLEAISTNFDRIAGNIKVSGPMLEQVLAKVFQSVQLNVVELSASDYVAKVAAPTTQQVQDQFTKYADVVPPTQVDPKNPYGFGYRLPDRVKVQYLTIDRKEAEKTVEKRMSAYDWEVQARLYYRTHKDEFPTTEPTTAPSASSTTQPSSLASSATQPTTAPAYEPYEKVADQALHAVRDPMVDTLMREASNKIMSMMTSDWRAYSQQFASGSSTTAPTTSPTAEPTTGYPSYSYLKTITDAIQKQFDLPVYVSDYDRYQSAKELSELPGIGPAFEGSGARGSSNPFAMIAMTKAKAYLARTDKGTPGAQAQLMQPTGPISDVMRNVYIFRTTDAQPAEPARNLDEVREKVEQDLKMVAAFDLAQTAAGPILESARGGSMLSAAMASGKRVITTPPFNSNPYTTTPPDLGPDIKLSPKGQHDFAEQAFMLLSVYNPSTNPTPAKLITLPEDGKVYVAQLSKVSARWDANTFYTADLSVRADMHQLLASDLRRNWFDYDAAAKRLDYQPNASQKAAANE
jgi:hypothetical protein